MIAPISAHVPGLIRTAFQRPLQADVSETSESFDLEVHQRNPSETKDWSQVIQQEVWCQFKTHQWIIEALVRYDISLYDLF